MRSLILTFGLIWFNAFLSVSQGQSCAPITLTCPADITITADPGACGEIVNYLIATNGDCPLLSLTQTDGSGLTSGDEFPIGTTVQTWASLDSAGNTDDCSFSVTIVEFPDPITDDACNNSINLSPDNDCIALVTADMILEGGPYGCYDNYIVTLTTLGGAPVPNPITADYIGQTLIASVADPSGNSCWGYINYEDYLITPLVCGSHDIDCRNNVEPSTDPMDSIPFPIPSGYVITPSSGLGPFIVENYDNCGDINLSFVDNVVELDCTNGGPYTRTIYRHWTATDNQGNSTNCTDTINLRVPTLSANNIFPDRDGTDAPAILCSGDWDANMDGIPQPDEIGDILNMNCDVWGEYTDYTHQLNCGVIIDRSWEIVNMCSGEFISFIQKIRLVDDEAPNISCESNLIGSTTINECYANYHVPHPTISDDCSSVTYEITSSAGTVINLGTAAYPAYVINGLPIGNHSITYTAVDGCGNQAACTSNVYIEDQVPPHVNCENNLTVYLGSGSDEVDVNDLLVFSSDACGISHAQLRRVTQGYCDVTSIDDLVWHNVESFCCEEAGQTILIEVGVWDIYGNFSSCISHVYVESNAAPSMTCPPDITVSCSFEIDFNDLSVFGSVVSNAADVQDVVIDDRDWVVHCKGQNYTGPMVWGQDGLALSECDINISEEVEVNLSCGRSIYQDGNYLPAITREFIISNGGGEITSCIQHIYILDCNPQSTDIVGPADVVIDACTGGSTDVNETGEPEIGASSCDEISSAFYDIEEQTTGDTCRHIIRHWTVTSDCAIGSDSIVGEFDQHLYVIKVDAIQLEDCADTIRPLLNLLAQNLIFNGDFELGDVGFTSEYGQFPSTPGGFIVDTFPRDFNFDHDGVDHTSGSGNMLIVDGSRTAGDKVWCQEIEVEEDVEYTFSVWVNNLITPADNFSDPNIDFVITTYSDIILSTGAIPESPNEWIKFETTWTAPESRTIELCFWSVSSIGLGNDFAVDDISFKGSDSFCELNPANGCEVLVDIPTPTVIDCDSMASLSWDIDFDHDVSVGFVSDMNGIATLPPYLPFGNHIIRWSASDMCGGEATCETVLILEDCEPPVIFCEDIGVQVIQDTNGITIYAEDIAGNSFDNCGDVTAQFLICDGESNIERVLFGLIENTLVQIDSTSGAIIKEVKIVGDFGPFDMNLTGLIYSQKESLFYSIADYLNNPGLVKFDLEGNAEYIGKIEIDAERVFFIDGITFDPENDIMYASASLDGEWPDDSAAESLILVNLDDASASDLSEIRDDQNILADVDKLQVVDDEMIVYDGLPPSIDNLLKFPLPISNSVTALTPINNFPFRGLRDFASTGKTLFTTTKDRALLKFNSNNGILIEVGETHAEIDFNGKEINGLAFVELQTQGCIVVPSIHIDCEDLISQIDTFWYSIVITDQGGNTDTCTGEFIVADSFEVCEPPRCELIYAITSAGQYYSINTATGEFTLISNTGITTGNNAVAVNDDVGIGYFGTLQTVHWVDLVDGSTGIVGDISVTGTLSAAAASYKDGYLYLGPEEGNLIQDIHRIKMSPDGKSFDSTLENLTNGSVPPGNFGDFIVLDGDIGSERMVLSIFNNLNANNIYEYTVSDNTFSPLFGIPSTNSSQITIDNLGNIWYFSNETSELGMLDIETGAFTEVNMVPVLIADMGRAWCPPAQNSSVIETQSDGNILSSRNIPNPFDEVTEIEFRLQHAQEVQIYVYSLNGSLLTSIDFKGYAGLNSWMLDEDIAAGTYFYRIQTEDSAVSGKMVKTK